jgi:hypothetical protein
MSNEVIDIYKHWGLMGFGVFWVTTSIMLWWLKSKGIKANSISKHAASTRPIAFVFGIVCLISSLMLITFFVRWFSPTFELSGLFNGLVVLMLLLYAIAGLVPDTKGIWHHIHVKAALSSSALLAPLLLILILNQNVSTAARVFCCAAIVVMILIWNTLRKTKFESDKFLRYQSMYFLSFDFSILVATYIR